MILLTLGSVVANHENFADDPTFQFAQVGVVAQVLNFVFVGGRTVQHDFDQQLVKSRGAV